MSFIRLFYIVYAAISAAGLDNKWVSSNDSESKNINIFSFYISF